MRANGPGQSAYLLLDVIDLLTPLAIPYAVVGGHAVSFYGVPRFTKDADATVWLAGTGRTGGDLKAQLTTANYDVKLSLGDIEDPIAGVVVVRDQHENQVDLLLGVRGMDADAAQRCLTTTLLGESVRMIGVEDLIAMKLFAGGVQDLEDVRGILEVSKERLNFGLLQRLSDRYGKNVGEALERVLQPEE